MIDVLNRKNHKPSKAMEETIDVGQIQRETSEEAMNDDQRGEQNPFGNDQINGEDTNDLRSPTPEDKDGRNESEDI